MIYVEYTSRTRRSGGGRARQGGAQAGAQVGRSANADAHNTEIQHEHKGDLPRAQGIYTGPLQWGARQGGSARRCKGGLRGRGRRPDKPRTQRPRNQEVHGAGDRRDKDKADAEQLDKARGAAMVRNTARFKIEVNATKTDTYLHRDADRHAQDFKMTKVGNRSANLSQVIMWLAWHGRVVGRSDKQEGMPVDESMARRKRTGYFASVVAKARAATDIAEVNERMAA